MVFEFWLIDDKNSINLLLPVTPGAYELDYGNEIQVVDATALGDINIVGYRRLRSVMLSGFFTTKGYSFVNRATYLVADCMDYVRLVQKWVDNKNIIRLVISSENTTKINAQFYIENIKYSENHESNGDINYTIVLREHRAMKTKAFNTSNTSDASQNKARTNTAPKQTAKTYTVVKGDYLGKISRKFYGDANQWKKIYETNKSVIGKNPNVIYPGQVYVIP